MSERIMTDELFYKHAGEYNRLIGIIQRLVERDKDFIHQLPDEIRKYQPFLGSCILGYTVDLKGAEADDVFILHLLVWAAYRDKPECRKKAVTEKQYHKTMNRNVSFFKYLEKEEGTPAFHEAVASEQVSVSRRITCSVVPATAHVLIALISLCFQQWPTLANMNSQDRGIVTIGLKSWVECLENLFTCCLSADGFSR